MSVPNLGAMRAVAERLDRVELAYAFVGGSVVNLLLDYPELTPARPTDDVDVIIDLLSGARYSEVEAKLRTAGFSHDMRQDAPKCRWILGGVTVDIMPTDGAGLGLNTAWFAEALATATTRTVANSQFRVVSPVAFLATKYTAFLDRGDHDYYGSHDLEDFMTVIDGRASIVVEVDRTPLGLRDFVIASIRQLLGNPGFRDALPGYLPPEEEGRIALLRGKLEGIANLPLSRN
jgi:predicted nucleotidyltransferase